MFSSSISSLSTLVALLLVLSGPTQAGEKLRALVVTGGHGFDPAFYDIFDVPGLEIVKVDQGVTKKSFLSGDVEGFDVIVFYDMWQKITEGEKKKFIDLLRKGQGIVVLHHAMANYAAWPEYAKIIGGKYFFKPELWEGVQRPKSTYKHDVKLRVSIKDPNHPITRGLQDFEIEDETYKKYWVDPGAHVLLTTDHPTSEKSLAWTRTYGKSRVVYIQLGHGGPRGKENAYTSPSYKKLVWQSIQWVANKVVLFNGRDLTGWEKEGGADWAVKDGILIGKQGPGNKAGDLFTRDEYSDFELQTTFQVAWPANSGIWFRYISGSKSYQADILEWKNPVCWTGSIYRPGKMFIAMNTDPSTVNREGWNTMVIRAAGEEMRITLNGKKVAEARDTLSFRGKFGIQVHAGNQFGPMEIRIKEMVLTPINTSSK